ncbi:MAG TPA: formimidoylglutamase [Lacunisphaera sp.]|nr:formimidoylglutamase [Lacunisphaera sp.]
MKLVVPHTKPARWPRDIAPGRFAASIRTDSPAGCQVALLGLPDDTGVQLNHGRPGARDGPAAFRSALAAYGVAQPGWPRVFDAGDVTSARSLEATHDRVTAAAGVLLDAGLLPVAVGGGHDLTFPFVRAATDRLGSLTGIYFDAHLDVRETRGSGMPFRKLIEECGVRRLHLHGFRPLVNSAEHLAWFEAHGGRVHRSHSRPVLPKGRHLFASFDLDVIDAAYAPGVSALNPCGWTPAEAEAWVRACGADARMRCFDLMELNPRHDHGGRTARLAAHLFLCFLAGFATR